MFKFTQTKMQKFDYIVVGSGLAGLYAAYKASFKGSVSGHRCFVVAEGATLSLLDFSGAGKLTGKGGGTTVYGVHAISSHIVGQTAGAADAGDYCNVFRCNAYLGHSLVQGGEEEVVTTTGAPSWLSLLEILSCICCHDNVLLLICC